ncbi:MAG: helix-turn-helix transcriptional regulator [Sphingobium sp.]
MTVAAAEGTVFAFWGLKTVVLFRPVMQALWDCLSLLLQKRHMEDRGDIFLQALVPEDIGPRILLARIRAGLTQEELAKLSGVARRTIIAIEPVIRVKGGEGRVVRRELRTPHASTLRKLARILLKDEPDPSINDLVLTWPAASIAPFGFGELSAVRRIEKKLTQQQVAEKVGVNVVSISRFERNLFVRKFYYVEEEPDRKPRLRLKDRKLAKALGFKTVAAHEAWLRAKQIEFA